MHPPLGLPGAPPGKAADPCSVVPKRSCGCPQDFFGDVVLMPSPRSPPAAEAGMFMGCFFFQTCLRSSGSSDSLRGELGRLEAACLDPSISDIRAAVVEMARVPLSWLEGTEQLLASAGMDPHASGKGPCPTGCPWEQTCSRGDVLASRP